jgi:hypothetical protein
MVHGGFARRAGAALLSTLAALLLAPAAQAAVNGFDGADGDQLSTCSGGLVDWQCLSPGSILLAGDGSGSLDDAFAPGSKQSDPDDWVFLPGKVPGKADLIAAWTHTESAGGSTYLDVGFGRLDDSGDSFLGVELNQVRGTWRNGAGADIPCRTDGDVLLSYEVKSAPVIKTFLWAGGGGPAGCPDGATGAWNLAPDGGYEASMNQTGAVTNRVGIPQLPASFGQMTFGEAALDLRAMAAALFDAPCEYFRQVSFTTRASSGVDSTLLDRVAASDVVVRACNPPEPPGPGDPPVDTTPPAAPGLSLAGTGAPSCDGTVQVSGTTEPGATVTVLDGDTLVGLADADAGGNWTTTVSLLDDGVHSLSAEATDGSGNTSPRAAVQSVAIDRTAPAVPALTAEVDGHTVTLTGTTEPGLAVEVAEGAATVGGATADDAGAFAVVLEHVTTGAHTYVATVTDACGRSAAAPVDADVVAEPEPTVTPGPTPGGTGTPPATADGSATGGTTPALPPLEVHLERTNQTLAQCVARTFKAYVTLKGVRRAIFRVDGRKVKVVRRPDAAGQFVATIEPAKLAPGAHKLTATVIFRKAGRKPRTLNLRFRRCDQCQSRRSFHIRVPNLRRGERAVKAVVFVNGRRVQVLKGKRIRARVVLVGLPKGRYKVVIKARTNRGRTFTDVRRYRTCVKGVKKAHRRPAAG